MASFQNVIYALAFVAHVFEVHALSRDHLYVKSLLTSLPDQRADNSFFILDANHDGRVDQAEVFAYAKSQGIEGSSTAQEFAALDANHDGNLDVGELDAAMNPASHQASMLDASVRPSIGETRLEQQALNFNSAQQKEVTIGSTAAFEAANIAEQLTLEETYLQEASALDLAATKLRSDYTSLKSSTMQRALKAAADAANRMTQKTLVSLTRLEEAAKESEMQAAMLHARSTGDLKSADELMRIADVGIKGSSFD